MNFELPSLVLTCDKHFNDRRKFGSHNYSPCLTPDIVISKGGTFVSQQNDQCS
jgi:hypothetical protein